MNNVNLEDLLVIANEETKKRNIENCVPLYPMLRVQDGKLYIGIMLTNSNANVWESGANIKPEYWLTLDPESFKVIEFNSTNKKDFIMNDLIPKNNKNKQIEKSKFIVNKKLQYKDYFMKDITDNSNILIEEKISKTLNNIVNIDGKEVKLNEYVMANIGSDIDKKIDELVDLVIQSKYSQITLYYDILYNHIINEYKNDKHINIDYLNLCIEIMNSYYDGVIGIDHFFNIR